MPLLPGDELARILDELKDHPQGTALADLARQVLLDRDDSGEGDQPPPDLETEAKQLDITREAATTPRGNLFTILEKGPQSTAEAAQGSACLALGLAQELARQEEAEGQRYLSACLPRLDRMTATTPWAPYESLARALKGDEALVFWRTALEGLIEEPPGESPQEAADQAARFLVRAQAVGQAPAALKPALAEFVESRWPPSSRQEARHLVQAGLAVEPQLPSSLAGELQGACWGGVARVVAAVTGVLLLRWLAHLTGRHLLGYSRPTTLSLEGRVCRMRHEVRVWERTLKEAEATFPLAELRYSRIEQRYPYLHLLVGLLGLVLGAALGVNYVVEGSCSAYPPLVLIGLTIIGGGVVLEILLDQLVPQGQGQRIVGLGFGSQHLRLRLAPETEAGPFLAWLEQFRPPPGPAPGPPRKRPSRAPGPPRKKPSPAPEPPRKKPSPAPEPPRKKPSPAPEPPRKKPSPAPEPPREKPSPAPEPPREKPSPAPESPREKPSPAPEPPREKPSPAPESPREKPSPAPESPREKPSPAPESPRKKPSPAPESPRKKA